MSLRIIAAIMIVAQITIAQTSAIWNGTIDTSWYNELQTEFTITTAEQLAGLAHLVNVGKKTDVICFTYPCPDVFPQNFAGKTVKLGANIMLNDTTNWQNWESAPPANSWTAIGIAPPMSSVNYFTGTFDGNGYAVSGVYINNNKRYQGLFGLVANGAIKNLGVKASYIKTISADHIGGIVSNIQSGNIEYCYFSGNISGNYSLTGGIAGSASNTDIKNCYSTGNVSGGSNTGGVVGALGGRITNCYSTSNVSGTGRVGGIVGTIHNSENYSIMHCAALNEKITVTVEDYVGRIVGYVQIYNGETFETKTKFLNNYAYSCILNKDDNTNWSNKGANNLDGEDISSVEILADGTIKGLFQKPACEGSNCIGWETQNGRLPAPQVFGKTVETIEMPLHLTKDENCELHIHDWGAWIITIPATCETPGERKRVCKINPNHIEIEIIPALGHDWTDWTITQQPTCGAEGKIERTCKRCGKTETLAISKLEHIWGEWNTLLVPTCMEEGLQERICFNDNSHIDRRKIEKLSGEECDFKIILEKTVVSDSAKILVKFPIGENPENLKLIIFDAVGNAVHKSTLSSFVYSQSDAWDCEITWNLRNEQGRRVTPASYLVIVEAKFSDGVTRRRSVKVGVKR